MAAENRTPPLAPGPPYRTPSRLVASCALCQSETVVGRCPRCGKPFCLDHFPSSPPHLCFGCENESDRRRRRINLGLACLSAIGGVGTVVALPAICAPLGLFVGLTIFALCAPVAHLVARRRWLRQLDPRKGIAELSTTHVRIAPGEVDAAPPSPRMLSSRRGGHEPPSRPPGERFGYHG